MDLFIKYGNISFEKAAHLEKKLPEVEREQEKRRKKAEKSEKLYMLNERLKHEIEEVFLLSHNNGELSYRKTFKSKPCFTRRKD